MSFSTQKGHLTLGTSNYSKMSSVWGRDHLITAAKFQVNVPIIPLHLLLEVLQIKVIEQIA